ncbi:hypothetical protein SVAN01_01858 [Stagonosporopsis vannaccii]|nr:hypothetical protein SVAN01_01858 [Stagonosporopsis vannaccii]
MPPTARVSTVEFRSLLLAPIRVRLGTLNAFFRPQCASTRLHRTPPAATSLAQQRALHLYKTARAKTALGMHKILDFDLYDIAPPSASKHEVDIAKSETEPDEIVKNGVTLEKLYEEHISPGQFIYLVKPIDKALASNFEKMREEDTPSTHKKYAVVKARIDENRQNKLEANRRRKGLEAHPRGLGEVSGALKEAHISLFSPPAYTRLVLDRVYNFIEFGSPVELCIRVFSSGKDTKYRPVGLDIQKWLHEHFPHLRPDFILKSMPEGTEFLINPVTNGCVVQFVLGKRPEWMGKQDLTARAFRVKDTVGKTLSTNAMAKNYLARQRKNAAKFEKSRRDVQEAAPSEVSDPSPSKKRIMNTRNIPSRQFSFELGSRGELSEQAGERQRKLRESRERQKEAKHKRRMEKMEKMAEYKAKQRHRWEGRGGRGDS